MCKLKLQSYYSAHMVYSASFFFQKKKHESLVIWFKRFKKKDHNHPTIVTYFVKNINFNKKEQNNHESRRKSTLKAIFFLHIKIT